MGGLEGRGGEKVPHFPPPKPPKEPARRLLLVRQSDIDSVKCLIFLKDKGFFKGSLFQLQLEFHDLH